MVLKKKYLGIKTVVLSLFVLLSLGVFCTTSYAVDKTDINIDLPLTFFDDLIEYYHNFANLNNITINSNLTSVHLKSAYDRYKSLIINYFYDTVGITNFEKGNLIFYLTCIKNGVQFTVSLNNNTIGDVDNLVCLNITTNSRFRVFSKLWYNLAFWNSSIDASASAGYSLSTFIGQDTNYIFSNNFIDGEFISNTPFFGVNKKPLNVLLVNNSIDNTEKFYFLNDFSDGTNILIPEEPSGDDGGSGDTPINPSGDEGSTGNIDYTPILGNINDNISNQGTAIINQISGDTTKIINALSGETNKITNTLTDVPDISDTTITSGDIESSLGFTIAQDPYTNFWTTLTNNLKTALLGSKRSIDISFQDRTWTISLDEYMVLPTWLVVILTPFSTCFFTFVLARQLKHIFDKLSSGNVDSLLKDNSEERYF